MKELPPYEPWSAAICAAEDTGDLGPLLAFLRGTAPLTEAGRAGLANALVRWGVKPAHISDEDHLLLGTAIEFREDTASEDWEEVAEVWRERRLVQDPVTGETYRWKGTAAHAKDEAIEQYAKDSDMSPEREKQLSRFLLNREGSPYRLLKKHLPKDLFPGVGRTGKKKPRP